MPGGREWTRTCDDEQRRTYWHGDTCRLIQEIFRRNHKDTIVIGMFNLAGTVLDYVVIQSN